MDLTLKRYGSTPHGTFGQMIINGTTFYTVERPWLDNKQSVSCVPLGLYSLRWKETTTQVPERYMVHTWYLDGETVGIGGDGRHRQNCAIHIGNSYRDVSGCIAVGDGLGIVGDTWCVYRSRVSLESILQKVGVTDGHTLNIIGSLCG